MGLHGVAKTFEGSMEAVAPMDLKLGAGCVTALLGPTGCGKSTLLRMIGGVETPTGGAIELQPKPRIGFCFQEPRLLPWRNVLRNVGLPLELDGRSSEVCRREAQRRLDMVGLGDASELLPAALSGGMRMRAAVARSLVADPDLLLLDEPFGSLDEVTRFRLDEEVAELVRKRGITVVLVTHSISEAVFLADEVVVLSPRPARIVERYEIPFGDRVASLRGTEAFARLQAEIYDCLRGGMMEDAP
ncbi:MAG: nitrate/sulfonate/bicarbonate ABC transporter ATP-binding protein [Planctomycetaceae bacterium]|nr:nitrate/sulfonate/bicarbonate ABC transporter ATP-binding protein [Planctomycetaceae bacterium]